MCTIRVGQMPYVLNKTLQICTLKNEIGLGYKSFQVPSPAKNGLKSGLEYYKSGLKSARLQVTCFAPVPSQTERAERSFRAFRLFYHVLVRPFLSVCVTESRPKKGWVTQFYRDVAVRSGNRRSPFY